MFTCHFNILGHSAYASPGDSDNSLSLGLDPFSLNRFFQSWLKALEECLQVTPHGGGVSYIPRSII